MAGCFEHGKELSISIKCGGLPEKLRKILRDSVPWICLIHFSEYTAIFFFVFFFFVCLTLLTKE